MKKITKIIVASSLIFCGSLLYSFNKMNENLKRIEQSLDNTESIIKVIKQEAATLYLEKRLINDDLASSEYWKEDYNPEKRFNYEFFLAYNITLSRTDSIEDTHKKMKELFYTDEVCRGLCSEKVFMSDKAKNYISGIEELLGL